MFTFFVNFCSNILMSHHPFLLYSFLRVFHEGNQQKHQWQHQSSTLVMELSVLSCSSSVIQIQLGHCISLTLLQEIVPWILLHSKLTQLHNRGKLQGCFLLHLVDRGCSLCSSSLHYCFAGLKSWRLFLWDKYLQSKGGSAGGFEQHFHHR